MAIMNPDKFTTTGCIIILSLFTEFNTTVVKLLIKIAANPKSKIKFVMDDRSTTTITHFYGLSVLVLFLNKQNLA